MIHRPALLFGVVLLGVIVLAGLGADFIASHDPYAQSLARRLRPPGSAYPLGTDGFGRDTLARLLYGARISLIVGAGGALLAGLIGAGLGMLAGYAGGITDRVISILIATRLALPALLVALAVLQLVGSGLLVVVLVLGITAWDRFAVVLRTATAQIRVRDYITRARVLGCSHWHILAREIFPNVASQFVVIFTFECAQCILAAAVLSALDGASVYLASGSTDLRKSIDGLAALVSQDFELDLFSNSLFVFCNKDRGYPLAGDAQDPPLGPQRLLALLPPPGEGKISLAQGRRQTDPLYHPPATAVALRRSDPGAAAGACSRYGTYCGMKNSRHFSRSLLYLNEPTGIIVLGHHGTTRRHNL